MILCSISFFHFYKVSKPCFNFILNLPVTVLEKNKFNFIYAFLCKSIRIPKKFDVF